MDDFLEKIMKTNAAQHQARQSDASTSFLQLVDRVFGKLYSEPDTMETSAARQILMREAPIQNTIP